VLHQDNHHQVELLVYHNPAAAVDVLHTLAAVVRLHHILAADLVVVLLRIPVQVELHLHNPVLVGLLLVLDIPEVELQVWLGLQDILVLVVELQDILVVLEEEHPDNPVQEVPLNQDIPPVQEA